MSSQPVTIKEPEVKDHSFDLEALKEEGLNKIQDLAGREWTDFNFHDPGVTILEILCYALSDLAYRADFDIPDLLNTSDRKKISNTLFKPEEILTTSPLSMLDFKRLILDMEGVKNCAIVPSYSQKVIAGSFDIHVEIHPDYEDASFYINIREAIVELVRKNRPPGIVFDNVEFLKHDPVGILLDVELSEDTEVKKIFAEFIQRAQNYFSPEIKFRSLQELLDKGLTTDIIFNGPVLQNGFLPDEELMEHAVRQRIFVSDLMSLVMSIPGVAFVRELKLLGSNDQLFNWIYEVSAGSVPRIDKEKTKLICRYKNTIIFESKSGAVELWTSPRLNRTSGHKQNTLDVQKGVTRNLKKYHSIQYDFPETYGIGPKGPSAGADSGRLAAIKQFKGYLMIYDQVMANFLSQLDHVKYLFSTEDIDTSYAVQLMDDIPGIEFLYKSFIENYYVERNNFNDKAVLKTEWHRFLESNRERLTARIQSAFETPDEFLKRRQAALDHLLARFGMDTFKLELLSGMNATDAIRYKLDLLRNFPVLSSEKYCTGPSSLNENIPGIKAWIGKNLDLKGVNRSWITDSIASSINEGDEQGFKTEVYTSGKPLSALLKYGAAFENILEENNGISIYDRNNEQIAKISFDNTEQEQRKEFVYRKIQELNQASENFLLIDHIGLKPSVEMPCFGFNVLDEKGVFFRSARNYPLQECDLFAEEFTKLCQARGNFRIMETSLKEFKISFTCSFGQLLSRAYYSSPAEANEQLDYFLGNLEGKIPAFSFSTKYEDLYINASNPFSYIVTVLLPDWAAKFQNEGFKTYVEEYLYSELPSHLAVNIKWLDFKAMKEFEGHLQYYQQVSAGKDLALQTEALDNLMTVLVV